MALTFRRTPGRAALGFIFVTVLLNAVSFSIVSPVLPNLVREFTGGDSASAGQWMSLMAIAWGMGQLVFSPILGALSDRFGRRPVLLLSSLGLAVDFICIAFAPTLGWFLLARAVCGATSANFPTTNAYVADIVPQAERAVAYGMLASALSVGFMIGPALGGWLGEYNLRAPFLAAAAVTLLNFLYGLVVLPESLPPERRAARFHWALPSLGAFLRTLSSRPRLLPLFGVAFLNSLASMLWGTVWVLFCGHRFGWSPGEMGLQILGAGLLGFGVQAWLVGPIVKRIGERGALLTGLAISAASLVYAALAPDGWWFVASMPIAAFGLLLGPGLQSLLSAQAGIEEQGRVQGAVQSLSGLATIIGPLVYGSVFAWSLRQQTGADLSGLALVVAAAFHLAALPLAAMRRK